MARGVDARHAESSRDRAGGGEPFTKLVPSRVRETRSSKRKNPALHIMFFARFLTTNRGGGSALVPLLIAAGCSDDTTAGPRSPSLTTIDVSVVTSAMEVGQEATATATARDPY